MNGTEPVFLKGKTLPPSYFETPNPYKNAPSCNVNLLQLSRYAKRQNKPLAQLTAEEVMQFSIGNSK